MIKERHQNYKAVISTRCVYPVVSHHIERISQINKFKIMRTIVLRFSKVIFLLMIFESIFSQEKSANAILSSMKEFDSEVGHKLNSIVDLNVYSYFELSDLYNTDLKRKMFEQSSDYIDKVNQLKQLKPDISKDYYFIKNSKILSDYILAKNGFEIFVRSNYSDMVQIQGIPYPPKTIESYGWKVFLSTLPIKESNFPTYEKLFIPIDNKTGLEIENNKPQVSIIFAFKVVGKTSFSYKCFVEGRSIIEEANILKADSVRLLIVNESLDKIYYDKLYLNNQTTKIKKQ